MTNSKYWKMQDRKLQDRKMEDYFTGLEYAVPEKGGPERDWVETEGSQSLI